MEVEKCKAALPGALCITKRERSKIEDWAMSHPGPRILLAMLCCLLTFATSASAEGAWVLWSEVTGPPTYETMYFLVSASDTKQACVQALSKRVTQTRRLKAKNTEVIVDDVSGMPRVSERTRMKNGSIWITTTRYVCLPDTVDPRGPKGSK